MNCKHVSDLLSQYAAGELSATVRAQVALHLHGSAHSKPCFECAQGLEMLQRALPLLIADARSCGNVETDLYAAFRQRLVTQSARPLSIAGLPLRARWLPRLALITAGLCALAGGRYYRQHRYDALMEQTIAALRQPVDNVHSTLTDTSMEANGQKSVFNSENWIQHGVIFSQTYSGTLNQQNSLAPDKAAAASNVIRDFTYVLPGGITYSWRQQPSNKRGVHLSWNPTLQSHSYDVSEGVVMDARKTLKRLEEIGDVASSGMRVTHEEVGGESLLKIQIDHYKQAMPAEYTTSNNYLPLSVSLWLDSHNRLRRMQTLTEYSNKTRSNGDIRCDYNQGLPQTAYDGRLDLPSLPAKTKIVVYDDTHEDNYRSHEAYRTVTPVWNTMSEPEKQQVQDTAARWASAWAARDETRLRGVVDTNWPLQIAWTEQRAALTEQDIWQRVWITRLANERPWKQFTIQTVFAYQADTYQTGQAITDFSKRSSETCLPGLNVLCWLQTRQADGVSRAIPAHLYMVKRPDGWKVFQFCRLALSSRLADEDN